MGVVKPTTREGWGELAREPRRQGDPHRRARQPRSRRSPRRSASSSTTWSIDGFVSEGSQPAEMGWGSHEKDLPPDGARHEFGSGAAIYLNRPGLVTRVRTWTPLEGPFPRLHHHPQ